MNRIQNIEKFKENPNILRSPAVKRKKTRLSLVGRSSLYLVNESDEVLKKVKAEPWGFSGELTLESDREYVYEDVQPNEGILVYEPLEDDGIYYSDFVTGMYIYIESGALGSIRINPKVFKKSVEEQVLMYEDLTTPRMVMTHSI